MASEQPELTYELLEPGFRFEPAEVTVTAELVDRYVRALGGGHPLFREHVPPGLAGLLARRGYLARHRMPPGGVLLAQSVRWSRPLPLELPLRVAASVTARERRDDGRGVATIEALVDMASAPVDASGAQGSPAATVATTIAWPR